MRILRYAKAIVAAVSAGLLAAQTAIPMSDRTRGWVTVSVAVLATVAVYAVPNTPAATTRLATTGVDHSAPTA